MPALVSITRLALPPLLALLISPAAQAGVVINEIFYNAPEGLDDLEYIELHNASDSPADISDWRFSNGIKFQFPAGTKIEASGFLILCRDKDRFQEFYQASVFGVFNQKLSNDGEKITLLDAAGKQIDSVDYKDSPPWPTGADGYSGSLERICSTVSGDHPANWASSPLSEGHTKPAGSPGATNACFSLAFPPVLQSLKAQADTVAPNQPITVEASVQDDANLAELTLLYRIAAPTPENEEHTLPMEKMGAGRYAASIPGHAGNHLIRYRVLALSTNGAQRHFPAETEPRPAYSIFVRENVEPAKIPFGWLFTANSSENTAARQPWARRERGRFAPEEMARFRARATLEAGIDLMGTWFELTANQEASYDLLQKLKPILAAALIERGKLIDDVLEGPNVEEKTRSLPNITRTFFSNVADSFKPLLTHEQYRGLTAWMAGQQQVAKNQGTAGQPAVVIRNRLNIEGAWHAITAKTEVEPSKLPELRKLFQTQAKERDQLIAKAGKILEKDDGFEQLRDQTLAFEEQFVAMVSPTLSPAQKARFEEARSTRNRETRGPGGPGGPRNRRSPPPPSSHGSAFVYFDPASGASEIFDFIEVAPRNGGQKVRFQKGKTLNGMSTINLLFETEIAVLAEPLAYELYRRSGMAAEQSFQIRLWHNGQLLGYHLLVEQPNRAFLRRNNIRDDGNLYKLLWYEQGVVGQHEKKTNERAGHEDIVTLVDQLEKTRGDEEWKVIQKYFDVKQVATYFAVNTVLSHWDGFFNNYFTYHDAEGTGKWSMYPWDQDQTWGIIMGGNRGFYDMPLTFGMEGDRPPGEWNSSRRGRFAFGGGGAGWWRPPGWFSGPLLANPHFRKVFLARTREILETVYTEEIFGPIIDSLGDKLREEVILRAGLWREDPENALRTFEYHLQHFRDHLKFRREYLLAQDEIQNARK